ncbi:MAG: uracil-DNA glycosylase family protein [Bacteroidales bacterium]
MEKSELTPFIRNNLDILFVGLNPAEGSNRNKHYFSVNQAFWNQLYYSGLINSRVDKMTADIYVFGSSQINFKGWQYGITDLVTEIAESDSSKIKPTYSDCMRLRDTIRELNPKTVVLLHGVVLKKFLNFLGYDIPKANSGRLGKLIENSNSYFFNIAFPHGNAITSEEKVKRYMELKTEIEKVNNRLKSN